ncbi:MAG: hypothetical protein PVJ15_08455 [Gammaproteobacteria bacterium]|jgi:hypothetical protein
MEENEVMDVSEVIPTNVDHVSQLWAQVQDVLASRRQHPPTRTAPGCVSSNPLWRLTRRRTA